jgi:hypothetical protein
MINPPDNRTRRAHSIIGYKPEGRPKDDFYPTPPDAVEDLLNRVSFPHLILEPACGDGAISKVLQARGYYTVSYDLHDHGYGIPGVNFLTFDAWRGNGIITNPPYSLATPFLRHALDLRPEKVAFLLKLQFLEGAKRTAYLKNTPLEWVLVFRRRLSMSRNGEALENGGMLSFAWFVWNQTYTGYPKIDWL